MTVSAAPFYHKMQLERRLLAPPSGSAAATFSQCFPGFWTKRDVFQTYRPTYTLYTFYN